MSAPITLLTKFLFVRDKAIPMHLSGPELGCLIHIVDEYNAASGSAWPSHDKLAKRTGYSRSTIKRAVAGLVRAGIVTKDSGWTGRSNRYFVDLRPGPTVEPGPTVGPAAGPTVGPAAGPTGEPLYTYPPRSPREGEEEVSPLRGGASPAGAGSPPARGAPGEFERFWRAYPKREGRGRAKEKFGEVLASGVLPKTLIAAAQQYALAKADVDPKWVKLPANWLAGECWLEDPQPLRRQAKEKKKPPAEPQLGAKVYDDDGQVLGFYLATKKRSKGLPAHVQMNAALWHDGFEKSKCTVVGFGGVGKWNVLVRWVYLQDADYGELEWMANTWIVDTSLWKKPASNVIELKKSKPKLKPPPAMSIYEHAATSVCADKSKPEPKQPPLDAFRVGTIVCHKENPALKAKIVGTRASLDDPDTIKEVCMEWIGAADGASPVWWSPDHVGRDYRVVGAASKAQPKPEPERQFKPPPPKLPPGFVEGASVWDRGGAKATIVGIGDGILFLRDTQGHEIKIKISTDNATVGLSLTDPKPAVGEKGTVT